MKDLQRTLIDRRRFSTLLAATLGLPWPALAKEQARTVGDVQTAVGGVYAQINETRRLQSGADILLGDMVWTEPDARAALMLEGGSEIFLGAKARLKIDRYVAASGGRLVLGDGAMVFDRDDDKPKTALEVRSVFGRIGVRGTRFFAGPSKGVFAVFCERGEVRVTAAGEVRTLRPGDGVDIPAARGRPSNVQKWGQPRIEAAFRSVLG